jgi:DNA-binding transcriptional regulator YiaG
MSTYKGTVQKPDPQGYPHEPKTIGEHIKKRRMDLGLNQADLTRHFKVTKDCIWYWENGRSAPHITYYPAIIAFLGYYPFDHETASLGGKIRQYKYTHGLTNRKLGKLFGVDAGTVAGWERNVKRPLARSLEQVLSVINSNATH